MKQHQHKASWLSGSAVIVISALVMAACAPTDLGFEAPGTAMGTQWGPLDEFRFRISGRHPDASAEEIQAAELVNVRARQEFIAACMSEQGFTYIPFVGNIQVSRGTEVVDAVDWESREFAEEYGFAFSINPPPAIGAFHSFVDGSGDPNWGEFRDAMSLAERNAWDEALMGPAGANWIGSVDFMDFENRGCSGAADLAVGIWAQPDAFAAINNEINILQQSILLGQFPEIIELEADWGACMADQGFGGFQSLTQLRESLHDEWQGLLGRRVEWGWGGGTGGSPIGRTPNITVEPSGGQIPDTRIIEAQRERERAAATASWDCRVEVQYDQRLNEVNYRIQNEFIDQHRAELDAWEEHAESLRASRD